MGKYCSRSLLLMLVAAVSIFISAPVFGLDWTDCSPADKPYSCFATASQYKFRIVDQGFCTNPATKGTEVISSFPQNIPKGRTGWPDSDAMLWCYEVEPAPKTATNSSMSHIDLQVAIPYFYPAPIIMMDSSGQVFPFNLSNGCLGDSTTGFEVGDLEACGVKWTYKVNPGGFPQRFSLMTKVTPETQGMGKGPVIMAAKVGNAVEPGFILGPDSSSAFSAAGLPDSTCQVINGFVLRFVKDDTGCTESVYVCGSGNRECSNEGTVLDPSPPPNDETQWAENTCYKLEKRTAKMTLRNINSGNFITPVGTDSTPMPVFLKEIGFVGGRNACGEGIATAIGSCMVWIQTGSSGYYVTTNVAGTTATTCRLPSAPTTLTATKTINSVTLTWKDNSTTEDGFKIERTSTQTTTACGTSYSLIATQPNPTGTPSTSTGSNRSYTNTGLISKKCYCYKVRGYLAGGGLDQGLGAAASLCVTTN